MWILRIDLLLIALISCFGFSSAELIVNIRNRAGQVFQQKISANVSQKIVEFEHQTPDGSLITHLIDFNSNLQAFRIILLGEPERGDAQNFQSICFLTRFQSNEYVDAEPISKLRQRNSNAIREPEEELESSTIETKIRLNSSALHLLAPPFRRLCASGPTTQIYVNSIDLQYLIRLADDRHRSVLSSRQPETFVALNFTRRFDSLALDEQVSLPKCSKQTEQQSKATIDNQSMLLLQNDSFRLDRFAIDTHPPRSDCLCSIQICIPWYPCKLKYCFIDRKKSLDRLQSQPQTKEGLLRKLQKSTAESGSSVRCGIKSCKKCRHFWYTAPSRQHCLWND